jgi:dolichol-phosphate mannosyltransferase
VVTPAYNEAENLPILWPRLDAVLSTLDTDWEWIIVDDHSADATFTVTARLAEQESRIRGIRLAANAGSHAAIGCGLDCARGGAAVVLAADLQDPPELLPTLLQEWRRGTQVVWAVRTRREADAMHTVILARAYHWLMRHAAGLRDLPSEGSDCFLLDRLVLDALAKRREPPVSVPAAIASMRCRYAIVPYVREARRLGVSGWNTGKKVHFALASLVAYARWRPLAAWRPRPRLRPSIEGVVGERPSD